MPVFIIRKPTIIRAGAVAKPGIAKNIGAQIRDNRNNKAQVSAAKPVRAPIRIPIVDSTNVVVVLVPRTPPIKVAIESASNMRFNFGISPLEFISGVLTIAPFTDPTVSKKSVKRNAKHTIRKSADSISFIPVTSDDAHAHLSVSNAAPKSVQNSPSDCVKDVTLKLGSRE